MGAVAQHKPAFITSECHFDELDDLALILKYQLRYKSNKTVVNQSKMKT